MVTAGLDFERACWERGLRLVAGVDEAGRGPLAGPVVAAAVILDPGAELPGVTDSKALSARQRAGLVPDILRAARATGIGLCSPAEIDRWNILRATHEAMRRALAALGVTPDHLLIDGLPVPGLVAPHTAIVQGDAKSLSIAAASILAKEERDRLMREYATTFPGYGFEKHAGYPTPQHLDALGRLGPCALHRRSFAPVRRLLAGSEPRQIGLAYGANDSTRRSTDAHHESKPKEQRLRAQPPVEP